MGRFRLVSGVALALTALTPVVSFALPSGTLLAQAGASRVVLDDGSVVEGEITSMTADEVVVKTSSGNRTIPKSKILRIEFGAASASTPAPPPSPEMSPAATAPPPQPTPPPSGWAKPGTTPVPSTAAPQPTAQPDTGSGYPEPRRGRRDSAFGAPHPAFVFNGFLGGKTLNEDWDPVGNQVQFGMEMTFLPMADIPLGFALDAAIANGTAYGDAGGIPDDDITYNAQTAELDFGIRFLQEIDPHVPVAFAIGGGVAAVSASYSATNSFTDEEIFDDGDGGYGLWASAGVHLRMLEFLNVGATVRWMSASNVVLFDEEIDPGGVSFAVTAGFSFGFPEQYRRVRRVYVAPERRVVPAPAPSGVREMWLTTPWGGSQYIAVGQWVVIERSDGPPVNGRVNRLFPDAVEVDSNSGLVYIPTNRIMRISAR
jgi:hypothetical protein